MDMRFFILTVGLLLWITGCQSPDTSSPDSLHQGKLVLTGSSTLAPVLAEIGRRYESQYPHVRINVQTGGSSRGIADPSKGLADIGMSSRDLKASEQSGRQTHVVARDGVAFVVHQSNPVTRLSKAQLRAIYRGEVHNWQDLGGADAEITVINRAQGRSELDLVSDYLAIAVTEMAADLVVGENQHGIKSVSGDPNAIIYISVGTAEFEVNQGAPLRLLALDEVAASTATVASGEYPLGRPLLLITGLQPSALAEDFLQYTLSAQVHDIIREQAFVPAR